MANIGDTIQTMLVGHIVNAKVVALADDGVNDFECEFISHFHTSNTTLCLDYRDNWVVNAGYRFGTRNVNIDRAAYHLANQ